MAATVNPATSAMDAEFLKRTVGEPLSQALTSLVVAQPPDPIEFIGEALLDYIDRREAESNRDRHELEVTRLLQMVQDQKDIEKKEKEVREATIQATLDIEQQAEEEILKACDHPEIYAKALSLVKERLGATGAQLGRKLVVEGQEIIEFIAASEGREDMVGKELKGLREGEDPEDGEATEEGVTFDLWKKTEQPPPAEPVYDEEGELVPDENEPELIRPEHVLIENVVRDPRVKFFGIPKLGAYLALPISYGSWLHPGGISDAQPPPEEEPSLEEGEGGQDETNDATADAAEQPAEGAGEVEEETPPKAPLILYSKNEAPVELVLCVDTIGQGRCFSLSDIAWAKAWAAKVKAGVEALESRMFDSETAVIPSLKGEEAAEILSQVKEGEEPAVEEALAALEEGTPEEEKERISKSIRYGIKLKAVEAIGDRLSLMGKLNLAPPVGVLDVLERALQFLSKPRAELCDARGALDWVGKVRTVVSTEIVPLILVFNPEDPASAVLAAEAKEAVESIDAQVVKDSNIPALAILEWMVSAITAAEDAAAAAAAAAEAAAIAAEEQAAAEAAAAAAAAEEAEEGAEEEEEG